MHLTYNFKRWEHFPEKGVSFSLQKHTSYNEITQNVKANAVDTKDE